MSCTATREVQRLCRGGLAGGALPWFPRPAAGDVPRVPGSVALWVELAAVVIKEFAGAELERA